MSKMGLRVGVFCKVIDETRMKPDPESGLCRIRASRMPFHAMKTLGQTFLSEGNNLHISSGDLLAEVQHVLFDS